MYSTIQKLSDKYYELEQLLIDFDEVLANTTEINAIYDDERGYYYTDVTVIDEDGIYKLKQIYERLSKIIKED